MPTPPPGWSLVRVETSLATPSDLLIDRTHPGSANVPGTAFVGTVIEPTTTGTATPTKNAAPPRRVVADPVIPCRSCERCRRGLAQHCLARSELGIRGLDGCWAEYVILPTESLIDVPPHIPDSAAVLVHDVARVLHLDRLLPTSAGMYISVVGDGHQAIVASAVLNTSKAKARLLSDDTRTLEHASRLSIRHRPLADAGLRADQDAIVLTDTDEHATNRAMDMIAPRGVLTLLRPKHQQHTLNSATIIAHELRVYGVSLGPIRPAIDWLAKEPTLFEGLLPDLRIATADLHAALTPPSSGVLLRWTSAPAHRLASIALK